MIRLKNILPYKKQMPDFIMDVTSSDATKRCLILYIASPFFNNKDNNSHQNIWQVRELARIISSKGYVVDVADYTIKKIENDYRYDLVIDLAPKDHPVFEDKMNDGCIRVAYMTGSNGPMSINSTN